MCELWSLDSSYWTKTLYFVLVISSNLDDDLLKNILKALHDHFTNQSTFPAGIYQLKFNNRNTRTSCNNKDTGTTLGMFLLLLLICNCRYRSPHEHNSYISSLLLPVSLDKKNSRVFIFITMGTLWVMLNEKLEIRISRFYADFSDKNFF